MSLCVKLSGYSQAGNVRREGSWVILSKGSCHSVWPIEATWKGKVSDDRSLCVLFFKRSQFRLDYCPVH